MRSAMVVQHGHRTGLRVHAFDASAGVIGRHAGRAQHVHLGPPQEAAVVADVERSVRTDRQPVRSAAGMRDHRHCPVRGDAADRLALDLHQHHRAVPHRHRPLRKAQPRRHHANIVHARLPRFPHRERVVPRSGRNQRLPVCPPPQVAQIQRGPGWPPLHSASDYYQPRFTPPAWPALRVLR